MKTQTLTVKRFSDDWSTEIPGEIQNVEIDGQKLKDIHDLTEAVGVVTRSTKTLAITGVTLASFVTIAILAIGSWIMWNHSTIQESMQLSIERNSGNISKIARLNWVYTKKLNELGYDYDLHNRTWVTITREATDRQHGSVAQ